MIQTQQLTKRYEHTTAIEHLTIEIPDGEIFGFLGPNGAGKTTTVKILTGTLAPTSGSASVEGWDVISHPLEVKKRVGYVPEHGLVYEAFTAREFLTFAGLLHLIPKKELATRITDLLHLMGLLPKADEKLAGFSKGMRQGVILASALLHNPRVLILDEPLMGLDANMARVLKEVIRYFAREGKTVIFCSHVLEVVEQLCTRLAILHQGHLIVAGDLATIQMGENAQSLEQAFGSLTGAGDPSLIARDILDAIRD